MYYSLVRFPLFSAKQTKLKRRKIDFPSPNEINVCLSPDDLHVLNVLWIPWFFSRSNLYFYNNAFVLTVKVNPKQRKIGITGIYDCFSEVIATVTWARLSSEETGDCMLCSANQNRCWDCRNHWRFVTSHAQWTLWPGHPQTRNNHW